MPTRIPIAGGVLELGLGDWDVHASGKSGRAEVAPFGIDRSEVTWVRWRDCAASGACEPLSPGEPTLPVTSVTPDQAAAYCAWAGGRLPSSEEWLLAAAGREGRRYPWGPFGLVCRRAVYGLEAGPCAQAGRGPEAPGSRPDGATPDDVLDLAGNVAEWTREGAGFAARGGSYRSTLASQLKVSGVSARAGSHPDVGFRCAYSPPDASRQGQ